MSNLWYILNKQEPARTTDGQNGQNQNSSSLSPSLPSHSANPSSYSLSPLPPSGSLFKSSYQAITPSSSSSLPQRSLSPTNALPLHPIAIPKPLRATKQTVKQQSTPPSSTPSLHTHRYHPFIPSQNKGDPTPPLPTSSIPPSSSSPSTTSPRNKQQIYSYIKEEPPNNNFHLFSQQAQESPPAQPSQNHSSSSHPSSSSQPSPQQLHLIQQQQQQQYIHQQIQQLQLQQQQIQQQMYHHQSQLQSLQHHPLPSLPSPSPQLPLQSQQQQQLQIHLQQQQMAQLKQLQQLQQMQQLQLPQQQQQQQQSLQQLPLKQSSQPSLHALQQHLHYSQFHQHQPQSSPTLAQQPYLKREDQSSNMNTQSSLNTNINNNNNNTTTVTADKDNPLSNSAETKRPIKRQVHISRDLLKMKQMNAALRLGIPPSTFSKRWRESLPDRPWPYRTHRKLEKSVKMLRLMHEQGHDVASELESMLKEREENLKPAVIEVNEDVIDDFAASQAQEGAGLQYSGSSSPSPTRSPSPPFANLSLHLPPSHPHSSLGPLMMGHNYPPSAPSPSLPRGPFSIQRGSR